MIQKFFNLELKTKGQGLYNFTNKTQKWVKDNNFSNETILKIFAFPFPLG